MIRKAAVAGYFYPGHEDGLTRQIESFPLGEHERSEVFGVIAPHAGYAYSGQVAAMVYARSKIQGTALLLGPNHGSGRGLMAPKVSAQTRGDWEIPTRTFSIDTDLARILIQTSCKECEIADVPWAHEDEHSLEVQLPFLSHFSPVNRFVPVIISRIDDKQVFSLAECIYESIRKYAKPVTLVASTDMSHYVPGETATRLDRLAMERIEAMDPRGLLETVRAHGISMCGVQPAAVVLEVCRRLGATGAELVKYQTSGDVSGDYSSVVGYCGYMIV